MDRVLVTGASGFIGRHLLPMLSTPARSVIAVGREVGAAQDGVAWVRGDLRESETWGRLPDDVTTVVHLASVIPGPNSADFVANVQMAERLVERAKRWRGLRIVVSASTIAVYGGHDVVLREDAEPSPASDYGRSKLMAERSLGGLDVPVRHLRLSSVFGPGQAGHTVLPTFVALAARGGALRVYGDGSRLQDFVFVDDVAHAFIRAFEAQGDSEVLNIGSGQSTSMIELARLCIDVAGNESSEIVSEPRTDDAPSVRLEIVRAGRSIGYAPRVTLVRGLRRCMDAVIG